MNEDLDDFFLTGGDELMNSEACPHCGHVFYIDGELEWVDKGQGICKCSECGEEVKLL